MFIVAHQFGSDQLAAMQFSREDDAMLVAYKVSVLTDRQVNIYQTDNILELVPICDNAIKDERVVLNELCHKQFSPQYFVNVGIDLMNPLRKVGY